MKERGISFSTDMIAAYTAGDKTQTRRLVTPRVPEEFALLVNMEAGIDVEYRAKELVRCHCPYGKSGDILYTREEHLLTTDGWFWRCEFKDGQVIAKEVSEIPPATLEKLVLRKTLGNWQRARFQPRVFSRADLVIKSIRVERLQEISEADAYAEGIQVEVFDQTIGTKNYLIEGDWFIGWGEESLETIARKSYRTLWKKINGPGSWAANPWVWVIEFANVNAPGSAPGEK